MSNFAYTGNTLQNGLAHANLMVALKVDPTETSPVSLLAQTAADSNGDFTLTWTGWSGRVIIGAIDDDGTVQLDCVFHDFLAGTLTTPDDEITTALTGNQGAAWIATSTLYTSDDQTTETTDGGAIGYWPDRNAVRNFTPVVSGTTPTLNIVSTKRYGQFSGQVLHDDNGDGFWNCLHNVSGTGYVIFTARFDTQSSSAFSSIIETYGLADAGRIGFSIERSGGGVVRLAIARGSQGSSSLFTETAANTIPTGTDVVVEVIKDSSNVRLFVNGTLTNTVNYVQPRSNANHTGNLTLGGYPAGSDTRLLNGRIYGLLITDAIPSNRTTLQTAMANLAETPPTIA